MLMPITYCQVMNCIFPFFCMAYNSYEALPHNASSDNY